MRRLSKFKIPGIIFRGTGARVELIGRIVNMNNSLKLFFSSTGHLADKLSIMCL